MALNNFDVALNYLEAKLVRLEDSFRANPSACENIREELDKAMDELRRLQPPDGFFSLLARIYSPEDNRHFRKLMLVRRYADLSGRLEVAARQAEYEAKQWAEREASYEANERAAQQAEYEAKQRAAQQAQDREEKLPYLIAQREAGHKEAVRMEKELLRRHKETMREWDWD